MCRSADGIQSATFKTHQALETEVENLENFDFDVLDTNATRIINSLVNEIMLLLSNLSTFNHNQVSDKKWDLLDMSEILANKQHKKGNQGMEVAALFAAAFVISFFLPPVWNDSVRQIAQQSQVATEFFGKYNAGEMTILQNELSVLAQQIGADLNKLNDQQKEQLLQVVAAAIRLKSSGG